jgi:tetratricopeptide (TPR) repeat protein
MNDSNILNRKTLAYSLIAVFFIFWGIIGVASLWLGLLMFYIFISFQKYKRGCSRKYYLNTIDVSILLIALLEAILYCYSTYPANSVTYPLVFMNLTMLWLFLRQWINESVQRKIIIYTIALIGILGAVCTLFFFLLYQNKVAEMGFNDLTQFRFLYHPMGMLSNDWASIMLAFLPFAVAAWQISSKYSWIWVLAIGFITFSILVSFSRGAIIAGLFWGILLLSIFTYYRIYNSKRLIIGICAITIFVSLICIPISSPLFTTLSLTKTESQKLSLEGRINKWKDAWLLFCQHPATGVGAGNFALKSETLSNRRETIYTGRCTNSWLQLIAEKGCCGIIVYGLCGLLWIIHSVIMIRRREKKDLVAVLFVSGILVCLFRETTFSTLFEKPMLLILLLLMLWLSLPDGANCLFKYIKVGMKSVISILLFLLSIFSILYVRQQLALYHNQKFISAYGKGDNDKALSEIQKSIRLCPSNALLHANEGMLTINNNILIANSKEPLSLLINDSSLRQAFKSYHKAIELNPNDAFFHCALGQLHLIEGDTLAGKQCFETSIRLSPHQAIYYIMHGICDNDSVSLLQDVQQAIYYAPDVLDSEWFKDISARHSDMVLHAIQHTIEKLSNNFDHIAKAKLAKILLKQNEIIQAQQQIQDVVYIMPGLNRPWLMLGEIAAIHDDTVAILYYKRALQLDPSDVLTQIRCGDWYMDTNNLSKAFGYYKDGLRAHYYKQTDHSIRSFSMYHTYTVGNDHFPPELLWYIKPDIQPQYLAGIISQGFEQENNLEQAKLYQSFASGRINIHQLMKRISENSTNYY